jgi:hypothetical protein
MHTFWGEFRIFKYKDQPLGFKRLKLDFPILYGFKVNRTLLSKVPKRPIMDFDTLCEFCPSKSRSSTFLYIDYDGNRLCRGSFATILSHSFTSHQEFDAVLFFVHPITGHVGPEGEEKFSCTLSLSLIPYKASGERYVQAALTPCSVRYCGVCTVAVDSPNFTVYRPVQCTTRQYLTGRGLLGHQLDSVGQKVFVWFCPNRMLLACDILQQHCGEQRGPAPDFDTIAIHRSISHPAVLAVLIINLFFHLPFIHSLLLNSSPLSTYS